MHYCKKNIHILVHFQNSDLNTAILYIFCRSTFKNFHRLHEEERSKFKLKQNSHYKVIWYRMYYQIEKSAVIKYIHGNIQ